MPRGDNKDRVQPEITPEELNWERCKECGQEHHMNDLIDGVCKECEMEIKAVAEEEEDEQDSK